MGRRSLLRFAVVAAGLAIALGGTRDAGAASSYDWLQFNGDPQHSGNNAHETALSPTNVPALQLAFQITLPAVADGAPVALSAVSTSSGVHDLLFLTTKDGHLFALDAHTGATIWQVQHGPGTCKINNGSSACFTTSSPAVDPGRAYVYAYGLEGSVHKHAVGTGAEVTTGGWPELTTTKPFNEKASSALATATAGSTSYLYVAHGGYPGDNGDYQGHVTAIDLGTGAQNVFNTACSDQTAHFLAMPSTPDCASVRSAVWSRGGVVYDAALDQIYFGTGNGDYAPSQSLWGDSVLALTADGRGSGGEPLDAYTPDNFQSLENGDTDVGSTEPAILPVPSSSRVRNVAVQSGKDGQLRLLDLGDLSSQGGPGHTDGQIGSVVPVPQGGGVFTAIAVWVNPADGSTWAFVANGSGISGLRLAVDGSGNPSLDTIWTKTVGGTSPVVANGVLYCAKSSLLQALDPTTGNQLWQNTTIGGIHWESPVVVNGTLYVADESAHLSAFTAPPPPAPALPRGGVWLVAGLLLTAGAGASRRPRGPRGAVTSPRRARFSWP
ncbi:MAG TPA: PQQ-binding-like beta-propeller repeat protein [Polyangiaceae bacterium]|jgi:outer membrane protein assembly factor BamB|nr:PQQ-binding-like beta-propeller repeat protein [Polyangiaceae bacterium]